jgi:hypothetical protein
MSQKEKGSLESQEEYGWTMFKMISRKWIFEA